MPKSQKYREFLKKLQPHGVIEHPTDCGKGSERKLILKSGLKADGSYTGPFYTLKCHGEGTELGQGTISSALRAFKINQKNF